MISLPILQLSPQVEGLWVEDQESNSQPDLF